MARVDVERTRLSAETMRNWLPKSLGPMTIRPGTKYLGSTLNDTGAEFIEFVAGEGETALCELTHNKMRVWIDDALLTRVPLATSFDDFADTGVWQAGGSTGGGTVRFNDTGLVLNANNVGGLARATRKIVLSDTGAINLEHALAVYIARGPITFRCGNDTGDDTYISETSLRTGYHSLAFTPTAAEFHLTFQSTLRNEKFVGSVAIENDTGSTDPVELTTPWAATNLDNIRYDQSADVVFVACEDVRQQRIERRGTGRSWSVVNYHPDNGPFIPGRTARVKLKVASLSVLNTTITADQAFWKSSHVGALFRLFHNGQSGVWNLGSENTFTDPIEMTGIAPDTPGANSERRIVIAGSGTWAGTAHVQRSFDGPDYGFHDLDVPNTSTVVSDTGTYTRTIDDLDDNITVWYRVAIKTGNYTSGTAVFTVTYSSGLTAGVVRINAITSTTVASCEVLKRLSSTNYTDDWNEGRWSDRQAFPTAVQLYEGRLWWAGGAQLVGSVSDDYENFDDETEGDSAPVDRTIGTGPVDIVTFLLGASRLLLGTSGSVLTVRSSGFDEPLTQTNANARPSETKGAAALRALLIDTRAVFVHRTGQRLFSLAYDINGQDYVSTDLSQLVPDLLTEGIVSVALQTFPDTRFHCVLADGTVALFTYDAVEEIMCWSTWSTDGTVERAMVLPDTNDDAVYYLVRRTVNGVTKRFLERWASESECVGGSQTWLADCAIGVTGPTSTVTAAHLAGEEVILWADGASLSPIDSADLSQTTFTTDTGDGSFAAGATVTTGVVGLPYNGDHVSTKLAYGAALGTSLLQPKRVDHIGFILYKTHNNGLYFGSDTGHLNPLPRDHKGQPVSVTIHETFDVPSFPFPGNFDTDSRIHLRCYAPHPVTVMASVPSISTHDKG